MNAYSARWPTYLLAACTGLALISASSATEVWVVTDHAHPVQVPPGARVTYLDAAARIERELSIALPADRARAAAVIQERMSRGGIALERELAEAYQGIADAWSAGITKVPAIIVDRHYIVYGEHNVERAIREIARHRSTTP